MKIRVLMILSATAAAASGQTDFVRQIQLTGSTVPLVYDEPVLSVAGTMTSKPLEGSGAVFQLYASGLEASRFNTLPIKVAEDTAGTYYPAVTVQIGSQDPHTPPRTRADKPFSLTFSVADLSDASTSPDYARTVELQRSYQMYDPLTHTASTAADSAGTYREYTEFFANGLFYHPEIYHQLPFESSTAGEGKETYTAYTRADSTGRQYQLGSAAIEIWPVSKSTIVGITEGAKYMTLPNSSYVEMKNLYPLSSTYVQVYKGKPVLGTQGDVLQSSVRTYDTTVPQNSVARLDDLSTLLTDDGFYTIEVLTVTPFNDRAPERLAFTYIEIDRTIEVRAGVTNLEE